MSDEGANSGGGLSRVQLDPQTAQMFQAISLFLQQQQAHERKEAFATRALQTIVCKMDQFDGRDISKYLRFYVREMELNRIPEKEMIETFELAAIPEIREHIKMLRENHGRDWEKFSRALRDEYFLEDSDRVTKKSFLEWVERPNKNLHATELLREFEKQFSQLTRMERLTLEASKTELFLRSADDALQEKLELLLEDKSEDEGLTGQWKDVEEAVGLLTKRERRREKMIVRKFVPMTTPVAVPIVPISITRPVVPIMPVRPSIDTLKKEDVVINDLVRGMRELQIKFAKYEEKEPVAEGSGRPATRPTYTQRCIWCDDTDHQRKECRDFAEVLQQGIIFWKDGKIALRETGVLLQTNFGKGGMRKTVNDHLAALAIASVEATSYGVKIADGEDLGKHVEPSGLWSSAMSTMQKGKMPREVLLRTAATIRGTTGWEDPVESLSVHAYIARNQHEAVMEEKRRRDEAEERIESSKRQTRGEKFREELRTAGAQDLPMEDAPSTSKTKEKGKSYKLQSDIEASTDLKGVLEERILNAKVEFTLREILGVAKREFHDVIIDIIKRKRRITEEVGLTHALDTRVSKVEEEEVANCCLGSKEKDRCRHVHFEEDREDEESLSHYTRNHWARATTETLVKVGDLDEHTVALIDHGSEINIMSKDLYKKGRWPIDMNHGWAIRAANNTRGELYGACPDVRVRVGDVITEQNFFVQETTSYPMILGQPYIIASRMETKVLDDGSAYARIRSQDGKRAVQFLTVPPNHERNRDRLRQGQLPKVTEEFTDFGRVPL